MRLSFQIHQVSFFVDNCLTDISAIMEAVYLHNKFISIIDQGKFNMPVNNA